MRFYLFFFLIVISSGSSALNYEVTEAEENVVSLNKYLNSIGVAKAKIKSKCKDDNCRYWLRIGKKQTSVTEKTNLIGQSRYSRGTFALVRDEEDTYVVNSGFKFTTLPTYDIERCINGNALAKGVSSRGNALCMESNTLYTGSQEITLPVEAVYATIGTNYKGYWQAAFIGEDYNVYVGNHKGFDKVDVGLHNQSDLKDVLHIFPISSTESLLSVYVYDNKRNKSLMLYRLSNLHSRGAVKQASIPIINTIETDAGLNPEVYMDKYSNIFVSSTAHTSSYQYKINNNHFRNNKSHDNPYQGKDMLELLVGASIRQTTWSIDQQVKSPNKDDPKLSETKYDMNQSLLKEVSLQGKFMGNPIALKLAKSEAEKGLSNAEKAAADRIYGYIGINDFFDGASTLRLEFRKETVGGVAEWEDESNVITTTDFINEYAQYSVLKTEEQGKFKGITYTNNNLPMAVAFFDSSKSGGQVFFDPDLTIKKLSFTFGYDESQYTSRYLFDYHNVYLSQRYNLGIFQYSIDKDIVKQAEAHYDKKYKSKFGLAIDASLELGYIVQRRSVDWGGAGFSFQVGLSVDADFYMNDLSEEAEVEDDEVVASFNRSDYRYGPFARINVIF